MKTKILFAEDELVLAKIVRESLESQNYIIDHCENGEKALASFKNSRPHFCLLDVMMPLMDGFSLGRKIRAIDPDMPIIFLTAKNTTADVVEGFASGGNDYLRKPFSMPELVARIENLLQLSKGRTSIENFSADVTKSISEFIYDASNQELKHETVTVALSYREHELLAKLLDSNKRIVNRKDILLDIWGDDSFFHSRNLDVYIRKLRKHFAIDSKVQIITLKGVGYRFVY